MRRVLCRLNRSYWHSLQELEHQSIFIWITPVLMQPTSKFDWQENQLANTPSNAGGQRMLRQRRQWNAKRRGYHGFRTAEAEYVRDGALCVARRALYVYTLWTNCRWRRCARPEDSFINSGSGSDSGSGSGSALRFILMGSFSGSLMPWSTEWSSSFSSFFPSSGTASPFSLASCSAFSFSSFAFFLCAFSSCFLRRACCLLKRSCLISSGVFLIHSLISGCHLWLHAR